MNLLLLAVAPIFTIILYIYFQDLYEKEPKRLLILSFIFGAILSIFIVFVLYLFTGRLIPITDKFSIWQQFIQAFFVVGLAEEFSKYVIVKYFAQPNKAFNEPYDGIIYAVMISLGFRLYRKHIVRFKRWLRNCNSKSIDSSARSCYICKGLKLGYFYMLIRYPFGILMGYFMGKAKF